MDQANFAMFSVLLVPLSSLVWGALIAVVVMRALGYDVTGSHSHH
jgi:hypothetical protein